MSLAKNKMALLYSSTNQSKFAQNKKKNIHAWRSLMNTISRKNINCLRSKIVYTVHNTTALVNFSTMNIIPFRVFIEIGEENYYELVRSIVQIMGESESGYWLGY